MDKLKNNNKLNAKLPTFAPLLRCLFYLAPLLTFLAVWFLSVRLVERGTFFYGSPELVWRALIAQAQSGALLQNTLFTLGAVLAGFGIGNMLGITIGIALSFSKSIASVATPYLVILGAIPVLAFAPMITIWFGVGIASKIAMAAFSTSIIAATQSFEGARNTPDTSIALLESLGATRWSVFRKVILPSSLTWLFSGLKLNIGVAILAVFIGEFISAEAGLGKQIVVDMGLFKTSHVIAGVVAISLLSLLLNACVELAQRYFMPWKHTA